MRCALAVLSVVVSLGPARADDVKHVSKDGKYSVRFPKGAEVQSQDPKGGEEAAASLKARTEEGSLVAGHSDLPGELAKRATPKQLLDVFEKALVDRGSWKVINSKDTDFGPDKLLSRTLLVERPKEGTFAHVRMIHGGARVYVVSVNGSKEFVTSKAATTFLDSFELTK